MCVYCVFCAQRDCHTIATMFTFEVTMTSRPQSNTKQLCAECTKTREHFMNAEQTFYFPCVLVDSGTALRNQNVHTISNEGDTQTWRQVLPRFYYVLLLLWCIWYRIHRSRRDADPHTPTACARLQFASSIFAILILNVRLNGYAMPKNLVIFS